MLRNNRFYVLLGSFIFSIAVAFWVLATIPQGAMQSIRLAQIYSLTSIAFLYFALLAGPLCYSLPQLPYGKEYLHSRRALGVAAFYFGLLHTCLAFFGELGGFRGLGFLSDTYVFSIVLSFSALIILFLLAITSFDAVIKKMTFPRWKLLQRFVYLAGVLILIHAFILGTHFRDLSEFIPQIFLSALAVLAFLEARRFDSFLQKKFKTMPSFGLTTVMVTSLAVAFYAYSLMPKVSLNMHSQMDMSTAQTTNTYHKIDMSKYPGMDGDKTKRYTTSFVAPDSIEPQQDTTLKFVVFNAASGKREQYFKILYEKPAHLVVVDSTLTYFAHIHPTPEADGFTITTQFPQAGEYHLYLSFQPLGAIEQQVAFTVTVGSDGTQEMSTVKPDINVTKTFGEYIVSLDTKPPFNADDLSNGLKLISFSIKDASGNPVTTLKPYLAAFGHLVMINEKTYEYLHVHPTNWTPPKPDENGGSPVQFMPLGLYGPIKPGIYRVFAEFNPDGNLITADYTVEIK